MQAPNEAAVKSTGENPLPLPSTLIFTPDGLCVNSLHQLPKYFPEIVAIVFLDLVSNY